MIRRGPACPVKGVSKGTQKNDRPRYKPLNSQLSTLCWCTGAKRESQNGRKERGKDSESEVSWAVEQHEVG